jgi:glycosyltransferase involved in cell wall biosynthesis
MRQGERRLAMGMTYYAPYVSGLTNAAKEVAEELVLRGWDVTVVASRHDPGLPREECLNGVKVLRTPVLGHVAKAVISPSLPIIAAREMRAAGSGNLHLPLPEAGAVAALLGRSAALVSTYQCDVVLPGSRLGPAFSHAVDLSSKAALRRSDVAVVTSFDYLESSRLREHLKRDAVEIPAPSLARAPGLPTYRDGPGPHVGFLGRIVEEKGIPYLVRAFRQIAEPDWRLLIGGGHTGVAGGTTLDEVLAAAQDDHRIRLLGFIPDDTMSDFYASLDVFAFPSVNSLEAFGIAQVEAMMAGVPVVASDLPGVRQPVLQTGFGRIAPPREVEALATALRDVVGTPSGTWSGPAQRVHELYGLGSIIDKWESLFLEKLG